MKRTPGSGGDHGSCRWRITVLADYSTLLIQDDDADLGEPERAWFDALAENWINTAAGVVGIGAARPFTVSVTVDVCRAPRPTTRNYGRPTTSHRPASRSPQDVC